MSKSIQLGIYILTTLTLTPKRIHLRYTSKAPMLQKRSSMAPWSVRCGVQLRKLSNFSQSLDGWPKIYYFELLRVSKGSLSRWSRLHLQSLAPTNPHGARVVSCNPFALCVIHKKGLCPSSGDINRLMMMIPPKHPHFTKITWLWEMLQTWMC
jgi:hypothetical protein